MKSIILIGYMGAGKTTIGHALAKNLGVQFYDLDWYIEMRFHKTVAQIFEERGEEGFREIERNMLHEVAEFENVIISCGGGTPCFFDNIDYMNSLCDTIYLKASAEVLAAHLKMGKVVRPLILGKSEEELTDYIQGMLDQREPYYMKAKHIINVDLLNSREKVADSVRVLREATGI
ncbi:MAG: shikimate kinase [Bacteroidaceae bacterium]|nr:shikimate kinase [Bacteroidaceae bacterium]